MIGNWPVSKDELYGPPPAYSIRNNYENPPPSYTPSSIYVVPVRGNEHEERSSSHRLIILSTKFSRYLLGSGLIHMIIGLGAIVCDIILTIMNESYSFTGLWTGALSIILGIYLILYIGKAEKRICSFQRLQFLHLAMCLVSIIALILTSINLASDACYKTFLGPDRCQYSPYLIKIILVTFFSLMFVQVCLTSVMIFVHQKKAHLLATRTDGTTPEFIG